MPLGACICNWDSSKTVHADAFLFEQDDMALKQITILQVLTDFSGSMGSSCGGKSIDPVHWPSTNRAVSHWYM